MTKHRLVLFGFSRLRLRLALLSRRPFAEIVVVTPESVTIQPSETDSIRAACSEIAPHIPLRIVVHADFPSEIFRSQRELADLVETYAGKDVDGPAAALLRSLYADHPAIPVGLKKGLLEDFRRPAFFRRVLDLLAQPGDILTASPERFDTFGLLANRPGVTSHWLIASHLWLQEAKRAVIQPLRYLVRCRFNPLRLAATTKPATSRVAVEMLWSTIDNEDNWSKLTTGAVSRVRTRWNNFFLEDPKSLPAQDLLYVFTEGRFDPVTKQRLQTYIARRGARSADASHYRPTWQHVWHWQIGNMLLRGFIRTLHILFAGPRQWLLGHWASLIIAQANRWELFLLHHRPAVMLGFDDQHVGHIARGLAFRRAGLKSVAMHHSSVAGPLLGPECSFLRFDLLYCYGPYMRDVYRPHWDHQPCCDVGPLRGELIHQSILDAARRREYAERYPGRRTILVALPGRAVWNLEYRLEEFFRALLEIGRQQPDLHFVLRPRASHDPSPHIATLIDQGLSSGIFSLELTGFDSWEMMAYADLIISPLSSMIHEALQAHRPIIGFCFNEMDEDFPYRQRCPEMVAVNGDELVQKVLAALTPGWAPPALPQLQREVMDNLYGKTLSSMRLSLCDLADSVLQTSLQTAWAMPASASSSPAD